MTTTNTEPTTPARRTLLRRLAARRLMRAEVIYLAAFAAFAVLAVLAHLNAHFGWDVPVALAIQRLPHLFQPMRFISTFGNRWHPFALTTATSLIFLLCRRRTEAAGLILSAGGGSLINTIIKLTVARPRPAAALIAVFGHPAGKSFPSGHVTFYVCYFGFLFFAAYAVLPKHTWPRRLALSITATLVATVGLSRVYLGAHWPSDTLGAYLLSGLWLAVALHLYRKWKQSSTLHPEDKAETTADNS